MRVVQVLIPEGNRAAVLAVLDDEGIDYAVWEETGRGDFEALVSFPIPDNGVEPVLDELRDAGIEEDAYTIVLAPETVLSRRLDSLRERYSGLRISRDELIAQANALAPEASTYYAFLFLSTIIATTGLLQNSAATIIGAMVVAPLMGPALSTSVGTVVYDRDLTRRGVVLQVVGLLMSIATAAVFGLLLKDTVFLPPGLDITTIPQVQERLTPNFLSLVLALGSGLAGAISLIRNTGSSLVGVAIAVALVPPAATAGLGIAWGMPLVVLNAGTLVLVNLLAINLSALILLWIAGYRPLRSAYAGRARSLLLRRLASIVLALVVLSVVLSAVTLVSYQTTLFQQQSNSTLKTMFSEPQYANLNLVDSTVQYRGLNFLLDQPAQVTVVVGRTPAQAQTPPPPDLAKTIDQRLTRPNGPQVSVEVVYVTSQRSK